MRNELSQNHNTHAVQKFSEADARKLVEDMLFLYGKKFTDQWAGLKKGDFINKLVEKLSDLTHEQFLRGLKRLDTAEWPPTIPEFKKWCVGAYEYQTIEDAWLQALSYEQSNRTQPISKFTKQAFNEVAAPYGQLAKSDTMFRVFSGVYKRIITDAREHNQADELLKTVLQVGHKESVGTDHKPVDNEIAKQQLENLKQKLHVKNRNVAQPQKLKATVKPKSVESMWSDPFDNPQGYLQTCAVDGIDVDPKIQRQFGGVV